MPFFSPSNVNVSIPAPSVGATTRVPASATSVTLLAANPARKGLIISNESLQDLYFLLGTAAASLTDYSGHLPPMTNNVPANYEAPFPVYTGAIQGIWSGTPTGDAQITELT